MGTEANESSTGSSDIGATGGASGSNYGRYYSRAQDRYAQRARDASSQRGWGATTGYGSSSGYGAADYGAARDYESGGRGVPDLGDRNPSQGFGAPREGGALGGETNYDRERSRDIGDRSMQRGAADFGYQQQTRGDIGRGEYAGGGYAGSGYAGSGYASGYAGARERGVERGTQREERRRWQKEPLKAREIMTKNPKCAHPGSTIREVAGIMTDENTGIVPVVDEDNRLRGVITDRDIVMRTLASGNDPLNATAGDLMTDDVEAVTPDEPLREVVQLMGDKQIRRIPVVDQNDKVVGIISMADVATRADYDTDLQDALEEISAKRSFWSSLFS
jgi:CBS domain-containing protein